MTIDWNEGAFLTYIFSGAFGRLVGFWQCCCHATFSYVGVEMIGIAANETKNPRDSLPPAVRRVSYRIFFYYVGAIFVLGLNVSVLDPILKYRVENSSYVSPFVLLLERAGLSSLSDIVNVGALIAAFSVATINLYMAVQLYQSTSLTKPESNTTCPRGRRTGSGLFQNQVLAESTGSFCRVFVVIWFASVHVGPQLW